jgi:hypothetical protein
MLFAVMRQRVNVASASIPGPKVPLFLGGARILEVFPLMPLVANEPLAVGALSYAGALTIGIAADRDACPDLDVFAAAVRDELHALAPPSVLAVPAGDRGLEQPVSTVAARASPRSEARTLRTGG